MRVLTCPDSLDILSIPWRHGGETRIFIAGGISNCPDWQNELIARFKDEDDLLLINPRRSSFNADNPADSEFQITWEHNHLKRSDAVLFWFPFQTLCPITLFELGLQVGQDKKIFVGCHPAYARKFDVEFQLKLMNYPKPHDNFEDLVEDVKTWHNN